MNPRRAIAVSVLAVALLISPVGPISAGPGDRISLISLADWEHVTVTLDLSRFAAERVGIIRIVNTSAFPIQGRIPACSTVFLPADAALSRLRPAESGDFIVGAKRTVAVERLFRVVDAGKRAPTAGAAYTLADLLDPVPDCTD